MSEKITVPVKPNTESRRRLSLVRVLIAISIVGMIVYGITINLDRWNQKELFVEDNFKPWFAAYVDVTSTPTYPFEQIAANPTSDVVLSFIVSSKDDVCTPTWGTYYTMDEASASLDLDRRIARLQQQDGKIAVSFGGALNDELSLRCEDTEKLYQAYLSVIERYNVGTIDLDLENQSLKDSESSVRRAIVIAKLQKDLRAKDKDLAIWLTLPVAPHGLTKEGTDAVNVMLSNGVDLAGINIMTMDYGEGRADDQGMLDASKQAVTETHRQLGVIYTQNGINLSDKLLWRKIGATPMIGQNDILGEIFTLEDAVGFNEFAISQGIGRMSMWSANRDVLCGENYVDVRVVSDSCSGVKEPKSSFALALSKNFDGDLVQNAEIITVEGTDNNTQVVDDPERSPYQIWQETGAYARGVKVVWHGNVYEAKWWTKGDLPDNPVLQSWETPWQLMGPVLPGEKLIKQPTLPTGTYPKWDGSEIYEGGDRVLFEGIPFQAKWWNQGESPAASVANADSSPWLALSQAQIEQILQEK